MRLTRERRKLGQVVVTILLGPNAVAALAGRGYVAANAIADSNAVTAGAAQFLHDALLRWSAA